MHFLRSRFLWSKLHTTAILFITPIEHQRAFPLQRGWVGRGTVRLLVSRYFPQSRFVDQAPHCCNSLYHSNRASTHVSSPTGRGREGDSTAFGKQIFSAKQVCGTSSTLLQFSLSLQSSFNACFLSDGKG